MSVPLRCFVQSWGMAAPTLRALRTVPAVRTVMSTFLLLFVLLQFLPRYTFCNCKHRSCSQRTVSTQKKLENAISFVWCSGLTYAHSHKQGIVKTAKQSSLLLVQAAAAACALCNSTTRATFGTSVQRFNLTIMILLLSSCCVAPEPCASWQRMLLHWSSRSVGHLDSSDSPP